MRLGNEGSGEGESECRIVLGPGLPGEKPSFAYTVVSNPVRVHFKYHSPPEISFYQVFFIV